MNEIQAKTFNYLTSGGEARKDALRTLIDDWDFLAGTPTNRHSENVLLDFLEDENTQEQFCDDGRDRFSREIIGRPLNRTSGDYDFVFVIDVESDLSPEEVGDRFVVSLLNRFTAGMSDVVVRRAEFDYASKR